MGAASSAIAFSTEKVLSEEQYKTLTPSTRRRFQQEAETKIAEQTMSDLELHMHLTLEYQRLVEELQERQYGSLSDPSPPQSVKGLVALQAKGAWNADEKAREKAEKRRLLYSLYKTDYQKELEAIRSAAAESAGPDEPEQPAGQDSWTLSRPTDDLVKRTPRCHLCNKEFTYEWQVRATCFTTPKYFLFPPLLFLFPSHPSLHHPNLNQP